MNALTVILSAWAVLALCAVLFIRGATSRNVRPAKKSPNSSASRFSIAE